MKRRNFLQHTTQAVALPFLLNGFQVSALTRSHLFRSLNPENDRVLVLVQLNGGNDGLNMVVPIDQYDGIMAVRENIALPENSVLPLTDTTALHPRMQGMQQLYQDGLLGVIQSVGYPNQNRSHFRSTDIWTSGSPADEVWPSGWLGRYMDGLYPGYPEGYPNTEYPDPFAIVMGSSLVSQTCQGTAANYCLALEDPFNLGSILEGEGGSVPDTPYGDELQFIRTAIAQTNAYSEVVAAAAEAGANLGDYPEDNRLAQQLRNVALLIAGGLQTKIYVVTLGGFDTHANQITATDTTTGDHANLLGILSDAVAAFQHDLNALGLQERVLGMTFSEFGRRIRSNDSFGTDHGTAAPLILFGNCVEPQVLGESPEIDVEVDIQEGVPMQYDFRDVYGSILTDWFEVEEETVRALLHEGFVHLPILRDCSLVNSIRPIIVPELEVQVYPNPFREQVMARFISEREAVRVSLFDALGSEIRTVLNRRLPAGQHDVYIEGHGLPGGVYYVRVQAGQRVKTLRVVKA
ncbi:MAG: DUF1501 domain-containing protein [Lewinella sp.]|nr:DUF1501 domain-containing protein [Lewinella sp.]